MRKGLFIHQRKHILFVLLKIPAIDGSDYRRDLVLVKGGGNVVIFGKVSKKAEHPY